MEDIGNIIFILLGLALFIITSVQKARKTSAADKVTEIKDPFALLLEQMGVEEEEDVVQAPSPMETDQPCIVQTEHPEPVEVRLPSEQYYESIKKNVIETSYQTTENTENEEVDLFSSPEDIYKAVIYSEIMKPKYF